MVLVSGAVSTFTVSLTSDDKPCHPKVYDWLLILPQEVKYIWRSSWNYTKVLYIMARYTPFAGMALMVRSEFPLPLIDTLPAHFQFPTFLLNGTSVTCAPERGSFVSWPVQSKPLLSFDHTPVVAVQLTFIE